MINIQKYQLGRALQWLGTKVDDGYRLIHRPFVARKYAKMGVDVTAPQNAKIINALSRRNSHHIYQGDAMYDHLLSQGVDPQLLTNYNLNHLVGLRYGDLLNSVHPTSFSTRVSTQSINGGLDHSYHLMRGNRDVGSIVAAYRPDGYHVGVLGNNTIYDLKPVKGVSEQAYNAVIGDVGNVISGEHLMSPWITTKVWNKYPNKTLLGNFGRHDYSGNGGLIDFGPVYKLNAPTYNVPVKYLDIFDLQGMNPQGKFVIDFNKGPMFQKGGKIKNY